MSTTEREIEGRLAFQEQSIDRLTWASCINCEHWRNEKCGHFGVVPPVTVIVIGCKEWEGKLPF